MLFWYCVGSVPLDGPTPPLLWDFVGSRTHFLMGHTVTTLRQVYKSVAFGGFVVSISLYTHLTTPIVAPTFVGPLLLPRSQTYKWVKRDLIIFCGSTPVGPCSTSVLALQQRISLARIGRISRFWGEFECNLSNNWGTGLPAPVTCPCSFPCSVYSETNGEIPLVQEGPYLDNIHQVRF